MLQKYSSFAVLQHFFLSSYGTATKRKTILHSTTPMPSMAHMQNTQIIQLRIGCVGELSSADVMRVQILL